MRKSWTKFLRQISARSACKKLMFGHICGQRTREQKGSVRNDFRRESFSARSPPDPRVRNYLFMFSCFWSFSFHVFMFACFLYFSFHVFMFSCFCDFLLVRRSWRTEFLTSADSAEFADRLSYIRRFGGVGGLTFLHPPIRRSCPPRPSDPQPPSPHPPIHPPNATFRDGIWTTASSTGSSSNSSNQSSASAPKGAFRSSAICSG